MLEVFWASPVALGVKNPHAMQEMQETQVQSLSWEDPLEEEMATHFSIFAWEIPWTKQLGGVQSMGSQKNWIRLSDQPTTKTVDYKGKESGKNRDM